MEKQPQWFSSARQLWAGTDAVSPQPILVWLQRLLSSGLCVSLTNRYQADHRIGFGGHCSHLLLPLGFRPKSSEQAQCNPCCVLSQLLSFFFFCKMAIFFTIPVHDIVAFANYCALHSTLVSCNVNVSWVTRSHQTKTMSTPRDFI